MSYERRGGHRRRPRDDYDDRRREPYETPEEKLKTAIIKLGEVDAVEELPRLQKQIQDFVPVNVANISEAIRIGVTEQPYKIPYYAALILLLHDRPEESTSYEEAPPLGRLVLEDLWKGFQAYLDKLAWREVRLCIHFFSHLTIARLVSPESLIALLQAFTAVLDEFGVSHGRAKRAALCAAEGLIIGGPILKPYSATSVTEIIGAIQAFNDTTNSAKWLVQPSVKVFSEAVAIENSDELLDTVLFALKTLNDSDFAQTADSFPQPYTNLPAPPADVTPFSLPSVLVPPEIIELDALSTEADAEDTAQVKKEEWPEYFLRLFDNNISPDPNIPAGYAVRTALLDIISIFEVNRKECARLLLEYPKWNLPGAFKPKPGAPTPLDVEPVAGKDWQLESTIIETILGALLVLPESSHKSVYYISLITELCKLSPSTVGPAVGKSIRKLYGSLSEGLDVEAARRFAEWFAVHMSNFGFQWVWKEWVPDLELAVQHPRRTFMRRAIEFEIRLSYHERIAKTLPEAMQSPDAHTIPEQAPGPDFEYDDPANPHHDAAQSVLNLFRGRAKAEDVIAHLDSLKTTLEGAEDTDAAPLSVNVDATVRSIALQSLLHIGSRSFSHLLNAIERYLPLLRSITSSTEGKAEILSAAAVFWRGNRQMVGIVFDKLMQYQIVDPTDVVAWTFGNRAGGLDAFEWDLMRGAIDKANGRVVIARRRVAALRKEEDDMRARDNAAGAMEVDAEGDGAGKPVESPVESPALATALKAFTSLTREQKGALSTTLEGFVNALCPRDSDASTAMGVTPNAHTRTVITEAAWLNRGSWDNEEWSAWQTWGWYRQFCRVYSPYLRNYSTTLYTVSFARLEGSKDPAAELLTKTWNVATGQDLS